MNVRISNIKYTLNIDSIYSIMLMLRSQAEGISHLGTFFKIIVFTRTNPLMDVET